MSRRTPVRRLAPKPAPRDRRAWSARYEIGELRDALNGARIVADLARHGASETSEDQRRAPHAVAAILNLVDARLQLLERTLARDIDLKLVLAHWNETRGTNAELADHAADDLLLHIEEG